MIFSSLKNVTKTNGISMILVCSLDVQFQNGAKPKEFQWFWCVRSMSNFKMLIKPKEFQWFWCVSQWATEPMSQSANPPTSQIGIRCSRAKKCSEGVLKVLYEMLLYVYRRLGDVLFCGTVVFGNTEQPRHWTTETTPGRIQAQWRTLLEMCELLFMTFYLPRNWRSLRNCL